MLEIQIGPPLASARRDLFDASRAWDEAAHPWRALAELELVSVLSEAENDRLRFNISNAPTTLGLFTPAGPGDGNAIAWYHRAVYRRAQQVRAALVEESRLSTRGRALAHRRRREISRITASRRAAPQNATKITPA